MHAFKLNDVSTIALLIVSPLIASTILTFPNAFNDATADQRVSNFFHFSEGLFSFKVLYVKLLKMVLPSWIQLKSTRNINDDRKCVN